MSLGQSVRNAYKSLAEAGPHIIEALRLIRDFNTVIPQMQQQNPNYSKWYRRGKISYTVGLLNLMYNRTGNHDLIYDHR